MNVEQLMEVLGVSESDLSPSSSEFEMQGDCKISFTFDLWAVSGVLNLNAIFSIALISIFIGKSSDGSFRFNKNVCIFDDKNAYIVLQECDYQLKTSFKNHLSCFQLFCSCNVVCKLRT